MITKIGQKVAIVTPEKTYYCEVIGEEEPNKFQGNRIDVMWIDEAEEIKGE